GGRNCGQILFGRAEARTCSFIRFLRGPLPTLIILLANSTPMVCEDKTRHSFLTKRCNMQDLWRGSEPSEVRFRLAQRRHRPASVGWWARKKKRGRLDTYLPLPLGPRRIILAR